MFLLRPWRETDAVSLARYADHLKIAVNLRDAFRRFDSIHAEPYARNMGSRRVLEKAGFTLVGTLRQRVYKCGEF